VSACSTDKGDAQKKGRKPKSAIPVTLAHSQKKTLPIVLDATGNVEAFASVEIRSQVTGILQSVHFKEGDEVKAGDLLFSIDSRPFVASFAKAEAELAKDKAELDNARREGVRYTLAAHKGFVSTEQADQATTRIATLTAMVKADQAAVDAARLERDYCSIHAPLTGRTGELQSDQGNLIKANADTPLITINQMQPALVTFTVPGRHLGDIAHYRKSRTLQVDVVPQSGQNDALSGTLSFIDNAVDPATGVIRLKATFANQEKTLWPGQMIDVRLQLATRPDCIVVPSQAVQIGQNGPYVFVLKPGKTVEYRSVTPGMLYQGETVIEAGLQAGEQVVTDGQMQLADGVQVVERGKGHAGNPAKNGKRTGTDADTTSARGPR
jgi:multidrug efflux system membrane fusion protein